MTIELANRLQKLRKEKGYSQEQLADLLGISRQAVSKWERGEASPDTDNLIELAKLYNMSIDVLLGFKEEEPKQENKESISITPSSIDIIDEEDHVHIDTHGIIINEKKVDFKQHKEKGIYMSIVSALSILAYALLGGLGGWWHPGWLVFLLMTTLFTLYDAITKRRFGEFGYPLLITTIYLFLGLCFGLWHPYWFLFITIPVYYILASVIDKLIEKSSNKKDK